MAPVKNGCFCGKKDQVYMRGYAGRLLSKKYIIALVLVIVAGYCGYWIVTMQYKVSVKQQESQISQPGWENFDFSGQRFPVLYNQEHIALSTNLKSLGFFLPIFSPGRSVVNPGKPRIIVEGNRTLLYFDTPGEYYLDINEREKLKVLVLSREEEISSNVLRLFDFLVANLVVNQGNDKEFYENSENFAMGFFKSKGPKMLLCGPTLSFFEMILRDRFNLPIRDVTFTGVYMDGGQLEYATHNVVEVFLPDKNKWMMFDVNNGLAIKWMDSFEITDEIRKASSTKKNISKAEFDAINFDFHYSVDAKCSSNAEDLRAVFHSDMVTRESARDYWHDFAKMLLGGPGYWGGSRFNHKGLSPDYQLYLSQYHQDKFLLEAQLRWQDNWNLKVRHVPPEQLKRMLDDAYAEEISAKKWLDYLPKPILMTSASP